MNAVISKTFETIIKEAQKVPSFLIIILIFASLFSQKAKQITDFFTHIVTTLLPNSITEAFNNLNLQPKQLIDVWSFLLITMFIAFLWNFTEQLARKDYSSNLELGGELLLYWNSIILLCFLIYNKISNTPINLIHNQTWASSNFFYYILLFFSIVAFLILFSIVHLKVFWDILINIITLDIKLRIKFPLLIAYSIFIEEALKILLSI